MSYENDYITLKWGTLKPCHLTNPALDPLIEEYDREGGSNISAMAQRDTPRQKEIICEMIEIIGKPVLNDWSGEEMSVEEAKEYVMNYGK